MLWGQSGTKIYVRADSKFWTQRKDHSRLINCTTWTGKIRVIYSILKTRMFHNFLHLTVLHQTSGHLVRSGLRFNFFSATRCLVHQRHRWIPAGLKQKWLPRSIDWVSSAAPIFYPRLTRVATSCRYTSGVVRSSLRMCTIWESALHSNSWKAPRLCIPTAWGSYISMFPHLYVPTARSMLIPTAERPLSSVVPQLYVPTALRSHSSMFIPTVEKPLNAVVPQRFADSHGWKAPQLCYHSSVLIPTCWNPYSSRPMFQILWDFRVRVNGNI